MDTVERAARVIGMLAGTKAFNPILSELGLVSVLSVVTDRLTNVYSEACSTMKEAGGSIVASFERVFKHASPAYREALGHEGTRPITDHK